MNCFTHQGFISYPGLDAMRSYNPLSPAHEEDQPDPALASITAVECSPHRRFLCDQHTSDTGGEGGTYRCWLDADGRTFTGKYSFRKELGKPDCKLSGQYTVDADGIFLAWGIVYTGEHGEQASYGFHFEFYPIGEAGLIDPWASLPDVRERRETQ